jgi:hypothetical protein
VAARYEDVDCGDLSKFTPLQRKILHLIADSAATDTTLFAGIFVVPTGMSLLQYIETGSCIYFFFFVQMFFSHWHRLQ